MLETFLQECTGIKCTVYYLCKKRGWGSFGDCFFGLNMTFRSSMLGTDNFGVRGYNLTVGMSQRKLSIQSLYFWPFTFVHSRELPVTLNFQYSLSYITNYFGSYTTRPQSIPYRTIPFIDCGCCPQRILQIVDLGQCMFPAPALDCRKTCHDARLHSPEQEASMRMHAGVPASGSSNR